MVKDKKNTSVVEDDSDKVSYEEKLKFVSVIAKPMASKKLAKKLYKCIKKGSKQKDLIRNGLKDVQARIRKGERGLIVFAGDVTPIEVMCHLPAVCEEKNIPYVFTPSRQDLGTAMGVKRGSLMVMIKESNDYKDILDECQKEIQALPTPVPE
ncbi:hypothetical protein TCAL_00804 [Tigriopus californicus]|uniref:H/ACA snoRNP protein NHP2 n=1 Tax=Tigriopus californicus TaxID=6832 RepID=A0A553NFM1_TIGCA|nr:H/ACA ribonucleoprotein complex subunit 2-like protein [Tigriopus californicus]TRY64169.1 hypothetical protein TCAL_00804 [Tigriopus californicus]|eukprot:TCALIF_00804-PA protein Name:"Similar to NHP2 H/ACA ribonucleoprotein complex subunit 2-like protein (Drosophila yakuba)" AED:0.11 eAED:0.11 QI:0/0/0/1/1/1/2/0/152